MLRDFVAENVNAIGTTTTVNLLGAPTGRRGFLATGAFATGAKTHYYISDGTQFECGMGTVTAGSPNTYSRDTVLANSSGTTARLNFAGAAVIYCDVPAGRAVFGDQNNNVSLGGYVSETLPALGTTTGSVQYALFAQTMTGNTDSVGLFYYRTGAGSDYTTAHVYLRRVVDGTVFGQVVFKANGNLLLTGGANGSGSAELDGGGNLLLSGYIHAQGAGYNQFDHSAANAIYTLQTGGSASTSLVCQLSNTSSNFAAWLYGSTYLGGITHNGSTVFYGAVSDYRTKEVHGAFNDSAAADSASGELLDRLPIYRATLKGQTDSQPMLLAHELQQLLPQAVHGEKDAMQWRLDDGSMAIATAGNAPAGALPDFDDDGVQRIRPQTVDMTLLIPALVAELQALRRRVATLEAKP